MDALEKVRLVGFSSVNDIFGFLLCGQNCILGYNFVSASLAEMIFRFSRLLKMFYENGDKADC